MTPSQRRIILRAGLNRKKPVLNYPSNLSQSFLDRYNRYVLNMQRAQEASIWSSARVETFLRDNPNV